MGTENASMLVKVGVPGNPVKQNTHTIHVL